MIPRSPRDTKRQAPLNGVAEQFTTLLTQLCPSTLQRWQPASVQHLDLNSGKTEGAAPFALPNVRVRYDGSAASDLASSNDSTVAMDKEVRAHPEAANKLETMYA